MGLATTRSHGGSGNDRTDYSAAAAGAGVTVNLATGIAGGEGADKLNDIENITGSGHNDKLTGDDGANKIDGGASQ